MTTEALRVPVFLHVWLNPERLCRMRKCYRLHMHVNPALSGCFYPTDPHNMRKKTAADRPLIGLSHLINLYD